MTLFIHSAIRGFLYANVLACPVAAASLAYEGHVALGGLFALSWLMAVLQILTVWRSDQGLPHDGMRGVE